ncbi:HK97 family phage prohead protease [Acidiferrimicrobium sp. IK]|uniref:HK97 family phage prohead protease n=1 Tax=Acidiferrimicrobium sp. IK TaxID=2871700 RepID=UPI0021CB1DC0|nr:HK97 family phage prohead protease [Acidiferrimicrobium sp. IK]MCU4184019.1 HK97 family phage prohead protease [Acidiferrimicrobium sp. IK]
MSQKRRLRMKVRATPDEGAGTFHALVSAYNLEYDVGWGWTEMILPGAFTASIASHPTIPIFYEHAWADGPLGVGTPVETDTGCEVTGRLYLGMAERIDVIYQAMLDEALEEWSVAFWPQTIVQDQENRYCDQIAQGDLAEASVCVRGANPGTETIDLRSQPAWIDGTAVEREKEVVRMRKMFNVPDLRRRAAGAGGYEPAAYRQDDDELVVCPECSKRNDSDAGWCDQCGFNLHDVGWRPAVYHPDDDETVACPQCGLMNDVDASWCDQCGFELAGADGVEVRARSAGHSHKHSHSDGTTHAHEHTHSGGNYDHGQDAADPDNEVAHTHSHPADDSEKERARVYELWARDGGWDDIRGFRSSRTGTSGA